MQPCDIKQLQSVLLPWRILQMTLPIGQSRIDHGAKDLDAGWPFTRVHEWVWHETRYALL